MRGDDCFDSSSDQEVLDGENQSRVRYDEVFPTAACSEQTQTRLCTDGSFGNWTGGSYDSLVCERLPAPSSNVASCRDDSEDAPTCTEYKGSGNLGNNQGSCSATWDATRGCPPGDKALAKCVRTANSITTTNLYYGAIPFFQSTFCALGGGTWTEL